MTILSTSLTSIYAGHIGDIELSSIALYQGVMSAIYFYLLFGMSSALATLCGQAFGAGQIQSTCIYVQRSWIILTATCTILLPIFVYATPILKLLGQDEGIAELAGRYSIQVHRQKNPTFAYFGFGLCGLPDLRSCCCGTSSTSSCWCCWSCYVGDGGSVHVLGLVTSCISLTSVLHCQLAPSSKMTSLEMINCFESVIPYMFSFAIAFPVQRFLLAQSKVKVIMCIAFVDLLIQNGLPYIFINVFGWGVTSLAITANIVGWLYAVALVVYTIDWCREKWISLQSSVMNCLEQWYITCIMLHAGLLDNPVIGVGSYSICFNIQGWDDMLLLGINTVICIGSIPSKCSCLQYAWQVAAIYSFCMKMFLSLLLGILFMTVIFFSKDEFAKIFTDSEDMILADSDLAHLLGVTIVLNSASQVMSGVAIGSRWQVMVGYINLACYYIVGLPIGIFLGFKLHLGVKGLWGGTMCSSILQILVLFTIILKTKWSKEMEQTAHRMRLWSNNITTSPSKKMLYEREQCGVI
uniref:Protein DETOXIFICATION n=1 Tax=Glycine max TaxID=3847 RepID=K7LDN7_SOYBN